MRFFKKKPAPESALVQQLTERLKRAEEQNFTLQQKLQREQEHRFTVQMALEAAVDNSWSIQEKMDIITVASRLQAEALREKQGELDMAKVQIQRLEQERTDLNACLCLQNTKILSLEDQQEMYKMVTDALKSSYGQLKVSTTRLETDVSTAKRNLEVSRRALDLKEEETAALQNDLTEERRRSGVLQEELSKLQKEMDLLRKSAEEGKVQSILTMEELSKEVTVLRNELREEKLRNQQLQQDITLHTKKKQTLVQELKRFTDTVEVEARAYRRDIEDTRIKLKNNMEGLKKKLHLEALNSAHLKRQLTEARETLGKQRSQHQVELQSLRDMMNCLKTEQRCEEQRPKTKQMVSQVQSSTSGHDKVLSKTEVETQTEQLQTERRQVFETHHDRPQPQRLGS